MKEYLKDKLSVLISSIWGKLLGLASSVLVVRFLSIEDFAEWSYYKTFIVFLLPIATLGMEQVLLRYSYIKGIDRKLLMQQTFNSAVFFSLIIFIIGVSVIFFIRPIEFSNTLLLIFVLLQLITTPFNLFQQYYFRIQDKFKKYSGVVFLTSLFVSISLVVGSYFSVESLALLGSLSFLIYYIFSSVKFKFNYKFFLSISKEQLKYGINIGLGGVFNKSIFLLDIIYIANILNDVDILAGYKVVTLLPFNLILLANSILIVDFGDFVNFNKKEILSYLFRYWKLGLLILLPSGLFFYFFNFEIINLIFGERYTTYAPFMFYYFLFISIIILLRSPIGQLLNALGYAGFNSIMTIIQTVLLGLLFIIEVKLSIPEMILYFSSVTLLLTSIQVIKLFKL